MRSGLPSFLWSPHLQLQLSCMRRMAVSHTSLSWSSLSVTRRLLTTLSGEVIPVVRKPARTGTGSRVAHSFRRGAAEAEARSRRSAGLSSSSCWCARRQTSSDAALMRLLQDADDPYLAAIQAVNLPKITSVMRAGPSKAVMAVVQRRPQVLPEGEPSVFPAPNPAANASAGAAVLESLRVHGLAKQHKVMAEQAKQQAKLSETSGRSDEAAAAVRHCWEGLCAVNAILRVQVEEALERQQEDPSLSPATLVAEDLKAAYEAYRFIYGHYKGTCTSASIENRGEPDFFHTAAWGIAKEQWEEEFVAELKELRSLFQAVGDTRAIPTE